MNNYRIYVEKDADFRIEAECLRRELNQNLSLNIKTLRLINVYDLFGFSKELLERCRYTVFGEVESGMEVVAEIQQCATLSADRPKEDISMTMTIEQ